MTGAPSWLRLPRSISIAVLLGLAGLALTVPFSNPDGSGMQWDELVLGALAAFVCWRMVRLTRAMAPGAARPWRVMIAGAALFATAQWLEAAFPGPAFDGFGVDKVLLFAGACTPLVTAGFLALQVRRTRWTSLVVDGLMVTVALLVVAEVLATPDVHADAAPADLRSMVLLYGGYAGVMLGGAGVLCTVSTAALRRSVTAMLGAIVLMAAAGIFEALGIVAPHPVWTAGSDVAVALGLMAALLACLRAPRRQADRTARAAAPKVSPAGTAVVAAGVLGIPLALLLSLVGHRPLSTFAVVGCAAVFLLLAIRLVLRIREDGRLSEDLVRREEDFKELIESSNDGVAIVDDELTLLFTSPAARGLLGIDRDAAGHALTLPALVDPGFRERVAARLADPAALDGTLHAMVAGAARELEIVGPERAGSRRVLYLRDVTARRRRERELERMAYTDHLTGLPNRAMLFRELARAAVGTGCLLVVDLDGFKAVNDEAGHEAGDQLLVEVARRLATAVRSDDLVARLGGDEFALLVTGGRDHAVEVAERVVEALAVPHQVAGRTFAIGGSVGVSALGAGGGQVAFREADAALREAKRAGKGCVRVASAAAARVDGDLAVALGSGEVRVRFDTALDSRGRTAMVHAVPSWLPPGSAPVRGAELWATAEQQGTTAILQDWLLRRACTEVAGLDTSPELTVAVSLPNGQVVPDGLAARITGALAATGLSPSRLTLSFTEETLLTSSAALVPELEAVRAAGVRLCLDNYGMGHSLFALLARVPLDAVRADLSLLPTRDDERALAVLGAIVQITNGFGLTVIAGGIHTPELRGRVHAAGVQLTHGRAQPHDLSRDDLAALLAAEAPLPV